MAILCEVGEQVFRRTQGPCPALSFDDANNSVCGIVEETTNREMRAAAKHLIGSGLGCDARFNGEPINHSFNDRLRQHDELTRDEDARARRAWNLTPTPEKNR